MSVILEVSNLNKHFGGLHVLKNIDFKLSKGEIVGILGPNGAGKTTLFNVLTGFIPLDSGEILWQGQSIRRFKPHKLVGQGMARTFQLCRPFAGLSVIENVWVGGLGTQKSTTELSERAMQLLAQVGLVEKAMLPAELLSYGDQRRLEMARALATEPTLLLLDEPFAGLGGAEIESLSHLIRQLHQKQQVSILLIEHKLREFMQLVSRVVAMDFGEIIAEGTPQAIVHHPSVIEAYIGKQHPVTPDTHA